MDQLRPGMEADESEFVPFDPEKIIKAAKKEKAGNASYSAVGSTPVRIDIFKKQAAEIER